jgi:hypothetical protein
MIMIMIMIVIMIIINDDHDRDRSRSIDRDRSIMIVIMIDRSIAIDVDHRSARSRPSIGSMVSIDQTKVWKPVSIEPLPKPTVWKGAIDATHRAPGRVQKITRIDNTKLPTRPVRTFRAPGDTVTIVTRSGWPSTRPWVGRVGFGSTKLWVSLVDRTVENFIKKK